MTPSREAGFTLIELLVTIVVLAIVVGGLAQALFVGLQTTAATATTLVDAADEQSLAALLLADVKGAQALGTTGGPPCPDPPLPSPAPARVLWTQGSGPAAGTTTVAAYVVKRIPADPVAGTAARSELRRIECTVGAPAPQPDEGVELARWPGVDGLVDVRCDGRPRSGGQTTLGAPLLAGGDRAVLADASGFPRRASGYAITVGGETMDVTGRMDVAGSVGAELTVENRSSPSTAHAIDATVTWGPAVLLDPLTDDPLTADGRTVRLSDAATFPATGPAYEIVVGGEPMTVVDGFGSDTLTVSRTAPVEHPAGGAVTHAICGAGGRFRGPRVATVLDVGGALDDGADTSLVLKDATGFPPTGSQPYEIVVGGETMTVVDGFGDTELTVVRRPGGTGHGVNTTVTWGQTVVKGELAASGTILELSDRRGLPIAGPEYRIVVDDEPIDEPMTVTGGFGTASLTVTRSSGVTHAPQVAVSWTPDVVSVEVPRGDPNGDPGAPPFTLSIARRAT